MIQIFNIQDKIVVPDVACYLTPELKAVMDNFPNDYLKIFHYIFAMTCRDGRNWYLNYPEDEREEIVLQDIQPFEVYLEDMIIEKAMDRCRKLYETPSFKIYNTMRNKLDDIMRFLNEEVTTGGKNGNAMDVERFMKTLPEHHRALKDIEKVLQEEQSVAIGKIRRAYDQLSTYKNIKEDNDD